MALGELPALAAVSQCGNTAAAALDESSAALERLTAEQLATRLPAFWMHGRARRGLGQFDASLADLERGLAIAESTGRERLVLVLMIESVATLIELGRLDEAGAAAEEGLELARLSGNSRMLLWAHSASASARLTTGDVAAALQHAEEAVQIDVAPDFHAAGQPGWSLGAALTAAGWPRAGRWPPPGSAAPRRQRSSKPSPRSRTSARCAGAARPFASSAASAIASSPPRATRLPVCSTR